MDIIIQFKKRKIREICFWTILAITTFFFWNFESYAATANYYLQNSLIEVVEDKNYVPLLYSLKDEDINLAGTYNLTLVNETYRQENYKLYLAISKTTNQEHLKIDLNGIKYLNKLYQYEDDNYRYYLLDTNTLTAEQRLYQFKLWNDISARKNEPILFYFKVEKANLS